jgi:hypothetical protein
MPEEIDDFTINLPHSTDMGALQFGPAQQR